MLNVGRQRQTAILLQQYENIRWEKQGKKLALAFTNNHIKGVCEANFTTWQWRFRSVFDNTRSTSNCTLPPVSLAPKKRALRTRVSLNTSTSPAVNWLNTSEKRRSTN